jgi:hypothetical protein
LQKTCNFSQMASGKGKAPPPPPPAFSSQNTNSQQCHVSASDHDSGAAVTAKSIPGRPPPPPPPSSLLKSTPKSLPPFLKHAGSSSSNETVNLDLNMTADNSHHHQFIRVHWKGIKIEPPAKMNHNDDTGHARIKGKAKCIIFMQLRLQYDC